MTPKAKRKIARADKMDRAVLDRMMIMAPHILEGLKITSNSLGAVLMTGVFSPMVAERVAKLIKGNRKLIVYIERGVDIERE